MVRKINFILILLLLSISSCSLSDSDPIDDSSSINTLISSFNGIKLNSDNINNDGIINNMPILNVSQAYSILKDIRKKTNCSTKSSINETKNEDGTDIEVVMDKYVQNKYLFSIKLNTCLDCNNNLYYRGYTTDTSSDIFKWDISLFSFGTDNGSSIKFDSESYIIMKIEDNGIKYIKIPMKIYGKFNTETKEINFDYLI